MTTKTVYQTLENRGNPEDVIINGPFNCSWDNSWLGEGFYFWDTFIENAHWWGSEIRKYPNGYIICQAVCDYDYNSLKCCDLVGNTEQIKMFKETYEFLKTEGLADENTTVKRIVKYLKDDLKIFNYEAIRANGIKSKNYLSRFNFYLKFENRLPAYQDFSPAIQICFYKKTSLNLRNFEIVFPGE